MKAFSNPKDQHHLSVHIPLPPVVARIISVLILCLGLLMVATWILDSITKLHQEIDFTKKENTELAGAMGSVTLELNALKNEDQYVRNNKLETDIKSIEAAYRNTVSAYEELLLLKDVAKDTKKFDNSFAKILDLLSKRNYDEAQKNLTVFLADVKAERNKIATAFVIPKNVPASNTPPGSGYARQTVIADGGSYLIDIITASLGSTKVIVDTASSGDCSNDCPVLPLSEFVTRNGAYAGVNGSYYCPASYPYCAGKVNSFDTLLMNKNKIYFNSANNVYSTVPLVVFLPGTVQWYRRSLEWGRDTGPDSVFAMQPLLLYGGNIEFTGSGDAKQDLRSSRSFVASKDTSIAIGTVHNATVAQVAMVLKALGFIYAINLDGGGSVNLWYGGYKVGPGRNQANVILFLRK